MGVETLISLISLVIALGSLVIAWRKGARESDKLEAETAKIYSDLAAEAGAREARFIQRLDEQAVKITALENENRQLKSRQEIQDRENSALRAENNELRSGLAALRVKLERSEGALTERNGRVKVLEDEVETLRLKVAKLEKRDTGELKESKQG